jgi:DNA-3-methyladenine glycosylase
VAAPATTTDFQSASFLGPEFFVRDTLDVARDLLGKVVVREVGGHILSGRLVEVEAYCGPEDRASHSWRGLTPRTRTMFGPPGHAYVYMIYGMHSCLNFVTAPEGVPHAVLIRALEPEPGTGRCSGPGLLTQALQIDRSLNGIALAPPDLYVIDDGRPPERVYATPRIGVEPAGPPWKDTPWRFCVDSPALSKPLSRAVRAQS